MLELYYEYTGDVNEHLVYQRIGVVFSGHGLLYEYNIKNKVLDITFYSDYKKLLSINNLELKNDLVINKRIMISSLFEMEEIYEDI